MIRAGLIDFGVQVQIEFIGFDQAGLLHGPQLHRIQEDAAVAGSPHEYRNRQAMTSGKQPMRHAALPLLLRIKRAQAVAQFRPGHGALELDLQG